MKPKIISLFISRKEWNHLKFHSFFEKKSEILHVICKNWVMYNTEIEHLQLLYFTKSKNFLDSQKFLEISREISLTNLDLEAFSFHFSPLEKSESDFHFTFYFSKRVNQFFILLFTSRTFKIHSRRTLHKSEGRQRCLYDHSSSCVPLCCYSIWGEAIWKHFARTKLL